MKYVFHTTVVSLEERSKVLRAHKVGDNVVTETANLGWYVLFEGSRESIFLGYDKPALKVGDVVKISFEKCYQKVLSNG